MSRPSAKAWWFLGGQGRFSGSQQKEDLVDPEPGPGIVLSSGLVKHLLLTLVASRRSPSLCQPGRFQNRVDHKPPDRGLRLKGCRGPSSGSPTKPHEPLCGSCGSRTHSGMQWHDTMPGSIQTFIISFAPRTQVSPQSLHHPPLARCARRRLGYASADFGVYPGKKPPNGPYTQTLNVQMQRCRQVAQHPPSLR